MEAGLITKNDGLENRPTILLFNNICWILTGSHYIYNMSDFYARPEGRFTEEIVFESGDSSATLFDVVIKDLCTVEHSPDHYINGGPICFGSYYERLKELMTDAYELRPSDRPAFIKHQVNIRKDKLTFLRELEALVADNQEYFNAQLANSETDYGQIINQLKNKLTTPLKERVLIAVELLNQARATGINKSIGELLHSENYTVVANDEYLIASELEKRGLIKATKTKDGVFANLTVDGVMFDRNARPHNEEDLSNADLLAEITTHFDLLMANQSVLIARGQFDLSEMSEEINEAVEKLNQKAGGKSEGAIRKIADSYLGKLLLSETTKRGIIKPVLDGAEKTLLEVVEAVTSV